jgi:hypothetical protein
MAFMRVANEETATSPTGARDLWPPRGARFYWERERLARITIQRPLFSPKSASAKAECAELNIEKGHWAECGDLWRQHG